MVDKQVRTIADIARLAGVSKSTVSRALRNSSLISEETRERIQAIAKQHDFKIHQPARRLSIKQSNSIAFVTHGYHKSFSIEDMFFIEILGAISSNLASLNYDLLLAHVDPYDTEWASQYLDSGRVDGFILMTSTHKQYHIQKLVEMQAPFIIWGVPQPGTNFCTVTGDNLRGGRLAAEHLLSLGKQKIAFLGGPAEDLEVILRYQGFADALQSAGLEPDQKRVGFGDFSSASGTKVMHKLLDQDPDMDALFANSDLMAIGAMRVIQERGLRVPEDISVIGYDDLSLAAHSNPPLTTIRQNIPESGSLLVHNLIQYLENGNVTNVSVPVDLVVRQSTMGS